MPENDPEQLRQLVQRYLAMARRTNDRQVAELLQDLAREYKALADRIEAARRTPDSPINGC